jgi:flagellar protein FliS
MSHTPNDSYFRTQVLSAPRHKLHLMLLEGALRHGRLAEALFDQGHDAAAAEAMARSREIVAELLASLKPDVAPALVRKVAGVYVYVHRTLVAAQSRRDPGTLRDALRVLEVECETWRQMCRQLDEASPAAEPQGGPRLPRPAFLDAQRETSTGASFEA